MWTTHIQEFYLVKHSQRNSHTIIRITEGNPRVISVVGINDSELNNAVKDKLKSSGAKVVSSEEMRQIHYGD